MSSIISSFWNKNITNFAKIAAIGVLTYFLSEDCDLQPPPIKPEIMTYNLKQIKEIDLVIKIESHKVEDKHRQNFRDLRREITVKNLEQYVYCIKSYYLSLHRIN